jgi:hypothetical protein
MAGLTTAVDPVANDPNRTSSPVIVLNRVAIPLSFAALALVADLFMLRQTAMWLINLSQRLRGTAGRAKPAE